MDERTRAASLLDAQDKAAQLFAAVETSGILVPGSTELDASNAVRDLAADLLGVTRHWHKRIVRSGPNTLEPYAENPPNRTLTDDDILFLDFGPLFEEWEADFGRTYVLGDDPVKQRLRDDLPVVFAAAKAHFQQHPEITGEQLYDVVLRLTTERGWRFGNSHAGHLVGEFPHEQLDGDKLDSYIAHGSHKDMRRLDPSGQVPHWILEIHLVDLDRQIGGFYEELLTL